MEAVPDGGELVCLEGARVGVSGSGSASTPHTPPPLQERPIDAAAGTATTNQAWRAKVSAEKAARTEAAGLVSGMKTYAESTYGKASPELLKFGFTPAKPVVKSVVTKVVSVTKGAATRALRNPLIYPKHVSVHCSVSVCLPVAPIFRSAS